MPAGQEIAFEPALALVLAQHLHHPSIGREMVVVIEGLGDPGAVGDLEHVLPAIGIVLVRAEQAEVAGVQIEFHHVAQEFAHDARRFGGRGARRRNFDRIVAKVREP